MLWLLSAALAAPFQLTDAGRLGQADEPAALVVVTPGVSTRDYAAMVTALEDSGLDAWLLRFPPAAQDPADISARWIPQAAAMLPAPQVLLIGHGLGGTLAAISVQAGHLTPDALILQGSPLRSDPHALHRWLADRPLPTTDLDLAALQDVSWQGEAVLPLLLGGPLQLEWVAPVWLEALQGWAQDGLRVDLRQPPCPVWASAGALDNLAPPETVRPLVPPDAFTRLGRLRLDREDPVHVDLLTDDALLQVMVRHAQEALR